MLKTCKEILIQAMTLSQTQNSKAFSWDFKVQLLNSVYSRIYNDLSGYSNTFVKYFQFTGNEVELPEDCNKVEMVYKGNDINPFVLSQSSQNHPIPGTYYIENNTLKIVDGLPSRIIVKYSTLPITLTAPDDPIDLTGKFEYDTILGIDDDNVWFVKDDKTYLYNFANEEIKETDKVWKTNTKFNNHTFTVDISTQTVMWNGTDVSNLFIKKDEQTGFRTYIKAMIWDNTHIATLYENGDLWLMTGDWQDTMVNPFLYQGRYFKSTELLGCCCNDYTGKGLLVKSDDKLLYVDFVPDTLLSYPQNVFFDIIEDKMAIQLEGLCGLKNEALQTKLTDDEMSFYQSLQRSQQGMRIKNDANVGRWRLW
jgi:hypothetical protein